MLIQNSSQSEFPTEQSLSLSQDPIARVTSAHSPREGRGGGEGGCWLVVGRLKNHFSTRREKRQQKMGQLFSCVKGGAGELCPGLGKTSGVERMEGRRPSVIHVLVVEYDSASFMHLTPGVVHNFPKAVFV